MTPKEQIKEIKERISLCLILKSTLPLSILLVECCVDLLEQALEVIEFYANKNNWTDSYSLGIKNVYNDLGFKARQFLEGLK